MLPTDFHCIKFLKFLRHLIRIPSIIKRLPANHVKFAPLFSNDTEGYHKDIKNDVIAKLDELGKRLNDDQFKIIDLYTSDFDNYEVFKRTYSRCPIKEFVCIIAANSKVYYCHDKAYLSVHIMQHPHALYSESACLCLPTMDCQAYSSIPPQNRVFHISQMDVYVILMGSLFIMDGIRMR